MASYPLGGIVPIVILVKNAAGALIDDATTALVIQLPDGTNLAVANGSLTHSGTGTYAYNYASTITGTGSWYSTTTSGGASVPVTFTVRDRSTDYADLSMLKAHLTIGSTDTVDDDTLYVALDAAQASVDRMTGRTFGYPAAATARLFSKVSHSGYVQVDDIATSTGIVVGTSNGDGTYSTLAATSWTVKPDNAIAHNLPITGIQTYGYTNYCGLYPAFQVTAKWGWPSLPPEVVDATLILAGRLFKRKGSPEGVSGFGDLGVIRITGTDPDVARLLAPYALPGIA